MYIIGMPMVTAPALVGLRFHFCHHRVRNATLFNSDAGPAADGRFFLLLVQDGAIELRLASVSLVASRGSAVIWEAGRPAFMRSSAGRAPSYYMICFTPCLDDGKAGTAREMGFEPFFRIQNPGKILGLARRLNLAFNGKGPNLPARCSILGLELFMALKPRPGVFLPFPERPDNRDSSERVDSAIAYIHQNYKKRIPLRVLADQASMHPVNFIRAFKAVTGLTPHSYLLERKIEKAKDFLAYYKDSPSNTCRELGFHDYAHFCRVFRKRVGVNPGDYRRRFGHP